jgi:hypothetical protein
MGTQYEYPTLESLQRDIYDLKCQIEAAHDRIDILEGQNNQRDYSEWERRMMENGNI